MKVICEQNRDEIRTIRFTMANPNPHFASISFVRWARHTCGSDLHQLMALEMVSPALEMVSLTRAVSFPPTSWGMSINPCDSADFSPLWSSCAAQHVISPISDWSSALTERIDGRPTLQYQPRPLIWHNVRWVVWKRQLRKLNRIEENWKLWRERFQKSLWSTWCLS